MSGPMYLNNIQSVCILSKVLDFDEDKSVAQSTRFVV